MKRTATTLVKTLIGLAVIVLVALAVVVGVARQLVTNIHEIPAETAVYLSEKTGLVVEFDGLTGSWKGLAPRFQLHNFRLRQSADQPPAILVRDLDLEILLLRSLLNLQPRVRLNLDGALLTLVQQEGRVVIEGLDLGPPSADGPRFHADDVADLISSQPRVNLTDSRVVVKGWYPEPVILNLKLFKAEAGRITRYLAGDVVLHGPTSLAFQLRAKVRGSLFKGESLTGDLYLDTARADWLPWIPPDKRQLKQVKLASLEGGSETWLRFEKGRLLDATSRFIVHGFDLDSENEIQPPQIRNLSGVARWQRLEHGGWQAGIENFQMVTPRFNWQPSVLSLAATPQADGGIEYGAKLDDADITPWLNYFLSTQPEQGALYDTLKALRPAGKLRQLALFMLHKDNLLTNLRVAARIEQFNSRAWKKYPGFRDLDIELWGRNDLFVARLNDDYLELNYPDLFRETLVLKHISGGLALTRDADGFHLQSGPLHINTDDVRSATQFSLQLPADKSVAPFMQLQATLRDVKAEVKSRYLPAGIIPPKLLKWLDESILAGRLVRGDIVVHGALGKEQAPNRRILLGFSVTDADLRFLPDWEEPVRHAEADVIVDRGGVSAQVLAGEYFGQTLSSGSVEMARVPVGSQHVLDINVGTTGPAEQGFSILQATPLGKMTGAAVKDMQLKGDLQVKLDLSVPMEKGERKLRAAVDASVANGEFSLQSRNLQVKDVQTAVHFDLDTGLSAPVITGHTLGGPVQGQIETRRLQQGGQMTALSFKGKAAVTNLQDWLKLSVLAPFTGTVPYQVDMQIPLGEARNHKHGYINVTSDLHGTVVDLPPPFAKAAADKRDFRVWMSLDRVPSLFSVRYAKLFELSTQSRDGQWQKGVLSLGGDKAVMPAADYFAVNGTLPRFALMEWLPVLERIQSTAKGYAENIQSDRLLRLDHSRLVIDDFVLGEKSLGRQQIGLRRQGDGWALQLQGDFIEGAAALPSYVLADPALYAAQTRPLDIQLDRLTWPGTATQAQPAAGAPPPWQPVGFSPLRLPPANVVIKRLQLGDGEFGNWSLKLRPRDNGVDLNDVAVQMRGVDFFGQGAWNDQDGVRTSVLWGDFRSDDVASIMRAWGSEPTMGSKKLNGSLSFQWPGAPFEFAVARTRGNLNVKLEDGTFYNVQSGVVGKFWGALNFETLLRRLQLNFDDLQAQDMVYDEITVQSQINNGVLKVADLQLESPAIKLQTKGDINLNASELDMVLRVTVPVTRNLVLPAAVIGGVPAAATVWAIEKVLGSQFDKLTTIKYSVQGSFDEPKIKVMDSFNIIPDKVSEKAVSGDRKNSASQSPPATTPPVTAPLTAPATEVPP